MSIVGPSDGDVAPHDTDPNKVLLCDSTLPNTGHGGGTNPRTYILFKSTLKLGTTRN